MWTITSRYTPLGAAGRERERERPRKEETEIGRGRGRERCRKYRAVPLPEAALGTHPRCWEGEREREDRANTQGRERKRESKRER